MELERWDQIFSEQLDKSLAWKRDQEEKNYRAALTVCQSPIEKMLAAALVRVTSYFPDARFASPNEVIRPEDFHRTGLRIQPQANIACGKDIYRVDFLITVWIGSRIVRLTVECDSHQHHQQRTKAQHNYEVKRERAIKNAGYLTHSFTGSEIFHDAPWCVDQVFRHISLISKAII